MESFAYLHIAIARETKPATPRDRIAQLPQPKPVSPRPQAGQEFPIWVAL